jgi:hypothetical protein
MCFETVSNVSNWYGQREFSGFLAQTLRVLHVGYGTRAIVSIEH